LRKDGTVGTIVTDGSSPKHNNRVVLPNRRVRKLTPKECFRLMGVKDEDFDKVAKNQSNSSLYHLAGDSIITNCLMAIFKEMI
jgi:DNA (cytosine-5)-methyltransferase 1